MILIYIFKSELIATLYTCLDKLPNKIMASKKINVRRCFPIGWLCPDLPLQKLVGTTTKGELRYRAILPKVMSFAETRPIEVDLVLDDGMEITTRITNFECQLFQHIRHW